MLFRSMTMITKVMMFTVTIEEDQVAEKEMQGTGEIRTWRDVKNADLFLCFGIEPFCFNIRPFSFDIRYFYSHSIVAGGLELMS